MNNQSELQEQQNGIDNINYPSVNTLNVDAVNASSNDENSSVSTPASNDENSATNNENASVNNENTAVNDELAAANKEITAAINDENAAVNDEIVSDINDENTIIKDKNASANDDSNSTENKSNEQENKSDDKVKSSSEEIILTVDKSTLVTLCQNLNTNLLVNIASYKNVLNKLKDSDPDETKKSELELNIQKLNELETSVSELLNSVQKDLDVPSDKQINPETVIKEASGSGSSGFMQKLLGAEAAAILGSMAAATVLMLGGARRKKITKRRRNRGRKSTKRTN